MLQNGLVLLVLIEFQSFFFLKGEFQSYLKKDGWASA
jgi:hypothetical protein